MGVPLLLSWLKKTFKCCFTNASTAASHHIQHPDNLYIDLNSFLYQAAAAVEASGGRGYSSSSGSSRETTTEKIEDLIIEQLYQLLDDVVHNLVKPKRLVYLAVDGVSPLGKLEQQRQRRRRHASSRRHRQYRGGSDVMEELWDSNCISVGTHFMLKVAQALHHYAVSRTELINTQRLRTQSVPSSPQSTFVPVTLLSILVDDVLRPGEGETKISEAIRRFRTAPNYNPDTSHVICSSDTDVTVTSLLLHEPRIHVLRYEPPTAAPPSSRFQPVREVPESTFFSIHLFREKLRIMLGLSPLDRTAPFAPDDQLSTEFERALHDIVFILLLFGNDFLPSVSGRIPEGTLDALLTLLAEDFVSRQRYIVDAATNHINFDAARYLLKRLFEIRHMKSEGLVVYTGDEGTTPHRPNAPDPAWGFESEEAHQQRIRAKENRLRKQCYCYWTMLQWALHYSAGEVKHWSCYYPYEHAPPLDKLAEYCGEISYAALRRFATREAKGAHPDKEEEDGMSLPTESAGDGEHDRGQPTDVLVQLLVLLPPQSKQLLPPLLAQCYSEVEKRVIAPMEKIDFDGILAWCEVKKKYLSEADRTHFRAYQFFSQDTFLTTPGDPVPSPPLRLRASDIAFLAFWPVEATVAEQKKEWERAMALLNTTPEVRDGPSTEGLYCASSARGASAFFGKGRGRGISAAAAAIRENRETISLRAQQQQHSADELSSSSGREEKKEEGEATEKESVIELEPRSRAVVDLLSCSTFSFMVGHLALLGELPLQRTVGTMEGNRLVTDRYAPKSYSLTATAADATFTRHADTHEARLQWRLAATQEDPVENRPPGLLPGVTFPTENSAQQEAEVERMKMKRQREEVDLMIMDPCKTLGSMDKDDNRSSSETGGASAPPVNKLEALRRRLNALKKEDVSAL